jgi:hypothetical protein
MRGQGCSWNGRWRLLPVSLGGKELMRREHFGGRTPGEEMPTGAQTGARTWGVRLSLMDFMQDFYHD